MATKKRPAGVQDGGATKKLPACNVASFGDGKRPTKRTKTQGLYEQHKGQSIPEPRISRQSRCDFKVISWNVAGLRSVLQNRSAVLQELVKAEKPAILAFLEHKLQSGDPVSQVTAQLATLLPGYHSCTEYVYCSAKKGYSGTMVVIRKDILDNFKVFKVRKVKIESGVEEGRTICIELENICIVFCYVMNSGDGLVRLKERIEQWDPKFREFLLQLAKRKPVLLLGDLNVAHRDEDIWNLESPHVPKTSATTPEERESFGRLLEKGFIDGFPHFHQDRGAFTYWSVRARNRQPNRGLRLDYTVASKDMIEGRRGVKLIDAFHLPHLAPSGDHCPVGACVNFVT